MASTHHQLSVIDDVETEDDASDARIDKVQSSALGEECCDESEDDKTQQNSNKNTWI